MGISVKKGSSTNTKKSDKINTIDISKIDFSFLNNEGDLDWVDTSLKKQNKTRLKAYNNYTY